ncbi:ShlB/FhaC/HecB family hemolysin secretion/activation protein [Achromobacter xylosoxidans]|uniref:ShlB/FhaC/HecB family hemolysin secretion/activation protein n=1 Tax=Alcaligenes xylosoxydans xylosoxydans TaxID=85698 RepID=UPI001F132870
MPGRISGVKSDGAPGPGKRWHAYVGGDNAGMESTGKNQVNAGLTLDAPLFLHDQLSVSWNSNADLCNNDAGSRAQMIVDRRWFAL